MNDEQRQRYLEKNKSRYYVRNNYPLYDRVKYETNKWTYTLFDTPVGVNGKTYYHTNMELAGHLSKDIHFRVERIELRPYKIRNWAYIQLVKGSRRVFNTAILHNYCKPDGGEISPSVFMVPESHFYVEVTLQKEIKKTRYVEAILYGAYYYPAQ